jgi:enoyl-CoA hydratase/carnithine racemase
MGDVIAFQLSHVETGKLIRTYAREAAALGFVRDVVRLRGRLEAAQFELRALHTDAPTTTVAEADQLVKRALEDRVL